MSRSNICINFIDNSASHNKFRGRVGKRCDQRRNDMRRTAKTKLERAKTGGFIDSIHDLETDER